MKKIYFLFIFLFTALLVNAQTMVTFAVDMNAEGASADGIFSTGTWMDDAGLGGEWQEPGSNTDLQLTDFGNGVYTLTVSLPAGDYQYKYANGTSWANAESGNMNDNYQADLSGCGGIDNGQGGYNRTLTVPDQAGYTVPIYLFNTCDESTLGITAIKELTSINDIKITPNPASDLAVVSFSNPNNVVHQVTLTSVTGQTLNQYNNVQSNLEIDTQNLAKGMYFIVFQNDKGEISTEKLIINR